MDFLLDGRLALDEQLFQGNILETAYVLLAVDGEGKTETIFVVRC